MRLLFALFFATLIIQTGPEENSMDSLFPIVQNKNTLFSIGLIADVQYCNCEPVGTRFYRSSLTKLKEAVNTFKKDSATFIINLGDLIEKDFNSYDSVLNILNSSGLKTYHCTGNHDYSVEPRLKEQIPVLQSSKNGYFSFVNNKFRLIFLNGNEISIYSSDDKEVINHANTYITRLKNEGAINAIDWNGGISVKQLGWLGIQLYEALSKNEKVLIFCHFPIAPDNIHNLLNHKEVLNLLEKYHNIIAWFNGHNHAGNYFNFNMINFITMKGMVETENSNSFAFAEVYHNKILIRGYGREKNQILTF
jgi:manganese-dependent ADP-ribose/CDP-alcohol diphosphatase